MTGTPPPVPSDADLRPLPFMPLHVAKLRDSDLAAECEPEACWYAVLLWCAAWHQLPAGSLPDNDTVLCKLIGLGRDLKTWRTHRDQALRGWYKADDGRLYHPVVAAEVVKAWRGRMEQAWRTECARIKKANQRNGKDDPTPTLEEFLAGRAPATKEALVQGALDLVPDDTPKCPEGQDDPSSGTLPVVPRENPSKGERQGERERERDSYNNNRETPAALRKREIDPFDVMTITDDLARRAGVPHTQPTHVARNMDQVRQWHGDGIAMSVVEAEIDRFRMDNADKRIATLAFFDAGVRAKLAAKAAKDRAKDKPMTSTIAAPPIKPLKGGDMIDDRIVWIRSQVGTAGNLAVDKAKLGIEEDRLVVIARSSFVAAQLREDSWNALKNAANGSRLADVEIRVQ